MAGFIKFVFSMALLLGLIGGALVIFFADSPFVHRLFPMMAAAQVGEPVEYIYLRRVKLALRERQPTDNGMLRGLYEDALNKKFDALLNEQPVDKQENVLRGTYVQSKRGEYRIHFDAYDKDGNGTLEKSLDEWGKQADLFRFTALDVNGDAVLTFDEFWQEVTRDVDKAFDDIDTDGNGELTRIEYIAELNTGAIRNRMVYSVDADSNGAVSPSELESANSIARGRWQP